MEADFTTHVVHTDGTTVIYVRGEIDITTTGQLRDVIEPQLGHKQSIVLDLSGVQVMDSSCLRLLVHAHGALTADGGSLTLRNPSDAARRLLTTAQVERYLELHIEEHPDS